MGLGMGITRSSLSFTLGTAFGIYVAQNYNVPNVRKLANAGLVVVKHIEESYRKSGNKKRDGDDDT